MMKKWLIILICSVNLFFIGFFSILYLNLDSKFDFLLKILSENNRPKTEQPKTVADFPVENDPYLGNKSAPVKMIMFSDYQCGFCKIFFDSIFYKLQTDYIDENKVVFIVKNNPLKSHPLAFNSALAGRLAYSKGKFWEFHKLAFENLESISPAILNQSLVKVGIDSTMFLKALEAKIFDMEVMNEMEVAKNSGVFGVPAFVINNKLYIGNRSYEDFKEIIDNEIALAALISDSTCD